MENNFKLPDLSDAELDRLDELCNVLINYVEKTRINDMENYIGTKQVRAVKMSRSKYNEFRNWKLPENENGNDEGYLVEYLDGGEPNTDVYDGYVSWSPKSVFEKAYQASGKMSFGHAIVLLKAGFKVARKGWNGKGMFLFLTNTTDISTNADLSNTELKKELILPSIVMKTADDKLVVGWLASQTDMLSEDWMIVE